MPIIFFHFFTKSSILTAFLSRLKSRQLPAVDFCENLESIKIPSSVTYIGFGAFSYCEKLKTVIYDGSKEDWDKIEIDNTHNDKSLEKAKIIFKK